MPEDVVAINAEFETQKRCNDVSRLFHNLRAARRREKEWPTEEEFLQQVADISEEAGDILVRDKVWIDSIGMLHLFEPDDFPEKKKKKTEVTWMWPDDIHEIAEFMKQLFFKLGATKVNISVHYEE